MTRTTFLLALAVALAASPAWGDAVSSDLAREILRRVPDWPQAVVEIPIEVYQEYVRFTVLGPEPPQPPEAAWVERVVWTVRLGDPEAAIEAAFDVVALPGPVSRHVRLLPAALVWRDVMLDGRAADLRRADDGWFWFDPPLPGRYRVTARAAVKPQGQGDRRSLAWATPPAAWSAAAVEADAAWQVRFSRAVAPIVGDEKGTRGTVGLAPGDRLTVAWQKPQAEVHRAARIETESEIGWTLADGVHQVRSRLDLRLWGGEVAELAVTLPPGADRVSITGPDVREVQTAAGAARVFLRGAVTGRTRLAVAFDVPRPATGRMAFPAFGVEGGSPRGGTLAIAGGAGAVLLELEMPGTEAIALRDLPDSARGLLSAPAVLAYRIGGAAWDARVDCVGMAEFPVRETLVDSALYTVLYRPDGHVMTKVLYEVRNRAQQYMKVTLPPGAQLLVARVAEQQKNLARGDDAVYVPLEKSVLTTAGLISFPVELVYLMRASPLERRGRFSLPLPRVDLPVAYARCALMTPDGMRVGEWQGTLRQVPTWSSETAELEFEYGRGHLAPGVTREAPPAKRPLGGTGGGGGGAAGRPVSAFALTHQAPEKPEGQAQQTWEENDPLALQRQMIQGKNFYRAGVDFYGRGDYEKAQELFNKVVEVAPNSTEADNAKKYLGNVSVALGTEAGGEKGDRSLRAATKAVQRVQQAANVEVLQKQEELLAQAERSLKAGDQTQAEAAYQVAVSLAGKLQTRGEAAKEQEATVRKAKEFLERREGERQVQQTQLAQLQEQVTALKSNIAQTGGKDLQVAVDALIGTRDEAGAMGYGLARAGGPQPAPLQQGAAQQAPGQGMRVPDLAEPDGGRIMRESVTVAVPLVPQPQQPPARRGPQVQLGEALYEQLAAQSGKAAGRYGGTSASALAPQTSPADQLQRLKQQVEELKSIQTDIDSDVRRLGTVRDEPSPQEWAARERDKTSLSSIGRKVAEKAQDIASQAKQAEDLARQGRIAEAQVLLADLKKEEQTAVRAAEALTKTGGGSLTLQQKGLQMAERAAPDTTGRISVVRDMPEPGALAYRVDAGRPGVAETNGDVRGKSVWFDDFVDLSDARANLAKARQAVAAKARELDKVRFDVSDITAGADEQKKLAEFVAKNYRWAMQTGGQGPGNAPAGPGAPAAPVHGVLNVNVANGTVVNVSGANVYTGGTPTNAGTLALAGGALRIGDGQVFGVNGQVVLQATDGDLAVANDARLVGNIQTVLERLRTNLGQRVAVGSRNVFVNAQAAEAAGIAWTQGANGVRYAVVNEGQLLGLLDVEQRSPQAAQAWQTLPREAHQDAVVGTAALVANGGAVAVNGAADENNTLSYNGNDVALAHDDYLVLDNGGYLTAVKSGRMQHWAAEAAPVRFPGVPAAVTVPEVGRTVKFEKTLLDASDSLELVTEYTWQGEEK